MRNVWFITGAGSGIGAGIAKAALKAGKRIVATGRNLGNVRNASRDAESDNTWDSDLETPHSGPRTRYSVPGTRNSGLWF